MNPEGCPEDEVLLRSVIESLAVAELDLLVAHLDDCETCQERLSALSQSASLDQLAADKRSITLAPPVEMMQLMNQMKSQSFETEAIFSVEKEADLSFLEPSKDPAYI